MRCKAFSLLKFDIPARFDERPTTTLGSHHHHSEIRESRPLSHRRRDTTDAQPIGTFCGFCGLCGFLGISRVVNGIEGWAVRLTGEAEWGVWTLEEEVARMRSKIVTISLLSRCGGAVTGDINGGLNLETTLIATLKDCSTMENVM